MIFKYRGSISKVFFHWTIFTFIFYIGNTEFIVICVLYNNVIGNEIKIYWKKQAWSAFRYFWWSISFCNRFSGMDNLYSLGINHSFLINIQIIQGSFIYKGIATELILLKQDTQLMLICFSEVITKIALSITDEAILFQFYCHC